ncbi:C40 family peptidase [Pontibacter sp. H259]|uniref:C40 family peptidase n=1 Tax=Pontibacter sp. H259 TaxID=3133421 RepID=UPI0030C4A599
MKKNLIILLTPVALLILLVISGYDLTNSSPSQTENIHLVSVKEARVTKPASESNWVRMDAGTATKRTGKAASSKQIIDYAMSLIGSPYLYAGITPSGFDCSGFVTYVFDAHNLDIPHSSSLQANEGIAITKEEAAPGDLVIFTGTDESVREPGHVGIVISEPGDTISFVHSSSNGGVKVSKVQGTRYDVRFLEVRRVL